MGRADNIKIFQDTEKLCKEKSRLKLAIKHSIDCQKLILETDETIRKADWIFAY